MSVDETLPAESRAPAREVSPLSGDADTMAGLPQNPGTHPRRSMVGDLQRGDELGRYVILSRLGAGGMGVVYAAYDPELDRKLAIKLLHHRMGEPLDSAGTARLVAEARAMAKLAHPNVITVFDAVTHAEQVAVVMEFVDGESLGEWLARGPHRVDEVLRIFVRAAQGLAAAHAAGITHRDFKPDNVMLGKDGRVRVMDFGLAHAEGAPPPADTADLSLSDSRSSRERLTLTGAIMGTPAYMAPEQYEGVEADGRADQFSFCVSLWEALYGERPFAGSTLAELTYSVTRGERRAPPATAPRVPSRVHRAIERGLSIRRDERWPSMERLVDELRPQVGNRQRVLLAGGVPGHRGCGGLGLARDSRASQALRRRRRGGRSELVSRSTVPGEVGLRRVNPGLRDGVARTGRARLGRLCRRMVPAAPRRFARRRWSGTELTDNLYERQTVCLEGDA